MECPLCGYALGPSETECAGSRGRGLPAKAPDAQVTDQIAHFAVRRHSSDPSPSPA